MPPRRPTRRSPKSPSPRAVDLTSVRALVARYLEWMRVQNYSPFSVRARDIDLRRFVLWCEARAISGAADVTRTALEDYKRHLYHRRKPDGRPITRLTQRRLLASVLAWTKWLERRGLVPSNPGSLLELPRVERHLTHPALSSQEVERVLGAIDVTQPTGIRDRALLELAYSTGMRRLEISHLKLGDIDAERGTVFVRQGKGKKDRVVPIGARALSWLDKYVEEVRPFQVVDEDDGSVFLSRFGAGLNANMMSTIGRGRLKRSGLNKPGAMHIYRHSAATGMLEGGADVRVIQEFLGHAQLNSTQIYTKVVIQTLKAVHARTHPAERPVTPAPDDDDAT